MSDKGLIEAQFDAIALDMMRARLEIDLLFRAVGNPSSEDVIRSALRKISEIVDDIVKTAGKNIAAADVHDFFRDGYYEHLVSMGMKYR